MLVDEILSYTSDIQKDLLLNKQLELIKNKAEKNGIAFWGTGIAGAYFADCCVQNGLKPVCAVDSFGHEEGETFKGVQLISAQTFFKDFPGVFVVIACSYTYNIDKILEAHNIEYIQLNPDLFNLVTNTENVGYLLNYADILNNEKSDIERVYNLLADDKSKSVFENVIKYRLTFDLKYIKELFDENAYFNNSVIPEFTGDVFIDCGAYTGDTLLNFDGWKKGSCMKYYALEPLKLSYDVLTQNIADNNIKYAIPLQIGTGAERAVHCFKTQDMASHICSVGDTTVDVDYIDNMFYNENVDFIKMDIEGFETETLLGAVNTIKARSPVIAASIYHKANDLWKIPLLINELNPNYNFYIRHYGAFGGDTVLYALPK